jgi:hypothetical protein
MPAGEVLARFQAGGPGLMVLWYAMTNTAALFIPIVLLMRQLLNEQGSPNIFFATVFGTIAGVVEILGLIRWPLLVPNLTRVYFDPRPVKRCANPPH